MLLLERIDKDTVDHEVCVNLCQVLILVEIRSLQYWKARIGQAGYFLCRQVAIARFRCVCKQQSYTIPHMKVPLQEEDQGSGLQSP